MISPTNPSTVSEKTRQLSDSMWDDAASNAKEELRKLETQLHRMQNAFRTFIQNKKNGVIWPGIKESTDIDKDLS